MTQPLDAAVLSQFRPVQLALFLDFDGTLVEMADQPHLVEVAPAVLHDIGQIVAAGGALAIITGRDIADIDAFLDPLVLPVAGVHGLVRRRADGSVHRSASSEGAIDHINDKVAAFANRHPSLLVERKQGSVALHYRLRPELEQACSDAVNAAASGVNGIRVLRGKMVIEAKAGEANKGMAVAAFLEEPPFAGKTAVFVGDDVTDEDAFAEVNRLHGVSVKVGTEHTAARYRVADVAALHQWLRMFNEQLQMQTTREPKSA